jgi:hypothetical protein
VFFHAWACGTYTYSGLAIYGKLNIYKNGEGSVLCLKNMFAKTNWQKTGAILTAVCAEKNHSKEKRPFLTEKWSKLANMFTITLAPVS